MAVLQMQRISICALKHDRKAILEKLQSMGMIEMHQVAQDEAGFEKMDTQSAKSSFEKRVQITENALDVLNQYTPEKKSMFASLEGNKLIDKKIIKYIKDENDIDKEDMIEQLDDVMEYSGEALENQVGKVKSIKVKFKKIKKLKGSKLEDKQEDYEDEYDIKVSQVARVEATIKVKGKDDDVEEDITMYVYKRAGKWYLDFSSLY